MKKLFGTLLIIAAVVVFSGTESKAQMSAGGGLYFATGIGNIGIAVNGKYDFNEKWSAAPAFTYFFKKDFVSWMVLDMDANYSFVDIDNVGKLYGIGGLGITFEHYDLDLDFGTWGDYSTSGTTTVVGLNLGAGLEIPVGDGMAVSPEMKLTIASGTYFRIGAKFMFGL